MPEYVDTIVLPALYSILAAVVPILAGVLIAAIRQWAKKQKAEWLRALLLEATRAADNAVNMVNQTYVDQIRQNDGVLNTIQAKEAFLMALSAAKAQLGQEGIDGLTQALGTSEQTEEALSTLVEAAVHRNKAPMQSAAEFLGE